MPRLTTAVLAGLAALLAVVPAWAGRPAPPVSEVIQGLKQTYAQVRTIKANFVQVTRSSAMGEEQEQRGQVLLERPRKMRWDFSSPEKRLFVTDGARMWIYSPAEHRCIRYDDVSSSGAGGLGTLLQDLDRVDEVFEVELIDDDAALRRNSLVLRLTPRQDAGFKSVRLEVQRRRFTIRRVVIVDAFDNQTDISFSQVRLDADIPDSAFTFEPPPGVEVVTPDGK